MQFSLTPNPHLTQFAMMLLIKLYEMGVKGKLWRVIAKSYQNIESAVMGNGHLSQWFPVKQSIRQCGSSSGLMYLVFINELLVQLQQCNLTVRVGNIDSGCPTLADYITITALNSRNM